MGVVDRRVPRLILAVAAVLAVLFVAGLLPVQIMRVRADSMSPTLRDGDRILVAHPLSGLRRGSLVVLDDPEGPGTIVKRLVGLGGERVAIEDGQLVVDGVPASEPYTDRSRLDGVYQRPVVVPPGHLYVLGDLRDTSVDSRHFGPVPLDSVVGEVTYRIWPSPGRP